MKKHIFLSVFVLLYLTAPNNLHATVLDFEDLSYEQLISGTNYAGLFWEYGNQGFHGNIGFWGCPPNLDNYPYSGIHNLTNGWGSTLIGIKFPTIVNVEGAYFAGQGNDFNWTTGVRVHGYLDNEEIAITNWFTNIDKSPDWFAMNLYNVDRIVVESIPVNNGGGWYGMDDLTFTPEPATVLLLGLGGLFLRRKR